jgi:hypothetical protein
MAAGLLRVQAQIAADSRHGGPGDRREIRAPGASERCKPGFADMVLDMDSDTVLVL